MPIKLKDLQSATAASIKAVVGKRFPGKPGVIVGFWLDNAAVKAQGQTANAIAADVARQVGAASGLRVKPAILKRPGGVLVGYLQPRIAKG